ncbi:hypothetical protein CCACVL1_03300, partial [Corchorus capsularis]
MDAPRAAGQKRITYGTLYIKKEKSEIRFIAG